MVPKHMFLTRGVGVHKEKLTSFEEALRSAGVAYCNLVSVSSILPPHCKVVPRKRGEQLLKPGEITFCVMATTLGVEFDPNVAWKEREQVFKMGGKIVKTQNITQSAVGKKGKWTTVIALAVFIPPENVPTRSRK